MTPRRLRKKPVVIEGIQWLGPDAADAGTGPSIEELRAWGAEIDSRPAIAPHGKLDRWTLLVKTREGWTELRVGAWLLRGVAGEFYPCDDEILRATYEEEDPTRPRLVLTLTPKDGGWTVVDALGIGLVPPRSVKDAVAAVLARDAKP